MAESPPRSPRSPRPPRPRGPDPRSALGRRGETFARELLEEQGLVLVTQNWKAPSRPGAGGHGGELDLVMRDGDILVIVEVRATAAGFAGGAAYTVGPVKRRRLAALAQLLLPKLGWRPRAIRFDVIALSRTSDGTFDARWYKNAFEC